MTPKEHTLQRLYQARTAHVRWANAIKLLVSGIDIPESSIPLSPADAPFGKWYYDEAIRFSLGVSHMVLEEIEALHLSLHDRYTKIYPIYFGSRKKSLLGGLLGNRQKASDAEIEFAHRYYEEIVELSDRLKHKLRVFESQLQSLGEERFSHVTLDEAPPVETAPQLDAPEIAESDHTYCYGARGR